MPIPEFSKHIAMLLKELRIKNNLSIEELAEKSGVSVYKIKSLENLEHDVRFTIVYRLCEGLKVRIYDFTVMLEKLIEHK